MRTLVVASEDSKCTFIMNFDVDKNTVGHYLMSHRVENRMFTGTCVRRKNISLALVSVFHNSKRYIRNVQLKNQE